MKIHKISLKNFWQFKNLDLDLTYPKGHEKAGKPLDKICFIGQSGTGKTMLLRLLKWFISKDRKIGTNVELAIPDHSRIDINFSVDDLKYRMYNINTDLHFHSFELSSQGKQKKKLSLPKGEEALNKALENIKPLLIHFPAELIIKRIFLSSGERVQTKMEEDMEMLLKLKQYLEELEKKPIIDFAREDITPTWHYVMKDLIDYRSQSIFRKNQISDLMRDGFPNPQKLQEAQEEFSQWEAQNINPIDGIAEKCLDPHLEKIGVKVYRDITLQTVRELFTIELENLEGGIIPKEFWSTGTWHLVQTLVPLYQMKPSRAVILMDEPEQSFYPDFQTSIIDEYTRCGPGSQFFFATHSPMIASCFEPWEVIHLKFSNDEPHSVEQVLTYEGENHVDNYKYDPKYLSWNSNLLHIFNLDRDGGSERDEALDRLAELNIQIRKLSEQELNSKEGEKYLEESIKLKEKLNWYLRDGKNA